MKDKTACFTGHRELREAPKMIASRLSVILEELIRQGYRYFGAAGAWAGIFVLPRCKIMVTDGRGSGILLGC